MLPRCRWGLFFCKACIQARSRRRLPCCRETPSGCQVPLHCAEGWNKKRFRVPNPAQGQWRKAGIRFYFMNNLMSSILSEVLASTPTGSSTMGCPSWRAFLPARSILSSFPGLSIPRFKFNPWHCGCRRKLWRFLLYFFGKCNNIKRKSCKG